MSRRELFDSVAEAIADCSQVFASTVRRRDLVMPVLAPGEMADRIAASAERSAILFGPERSGLETEDVALANAIVTVPINPEFGSLNLAQAVILLAYEWSRRSELAQPPARELEPPAPHAEIEGLIGQLEGELDGQRLLPSPVADPGDARTPSARSSPKPAGLRARSRPFVELFARWSILRAKDSCRAAQFVVIGRKYLDWGGIIVRLLLGVIGAGLVLAAGAAQAKDPASPAAEKPICKRVYDADTGSHFTSSKRVCHTAAEWKEIEDGTERTMRTLRDNGGANPGALSSGGLGAGPQ